MRAIGPRERIIRGLLYKEWLAHRNLIVGFWAVWLVCGLVLPVFHHPAWVFGLGLLYVFFAGPTIGGMDAAEGSEEFTFSLPATRTEIYLTRLALFGGNLIALLVVGLLTIAFNVSQQLWGLFVESGLTEPFPVARGLWYAIAFCAPLAAGACAFVLGALAKSRGAVTNAGMQGVFFAGIVGSAGMTAEHFCWQHTNGLIVCPALLVLTAAVLALGICQFTRKEGVSRPAAVGEGKRRLWIIVSILMLGFLMGPIVAGFWWCNVRQGASRLQGGEEMPDRVSNRMSSQVEALRVRVARASGEWQVASVEGRQRTAAVGMELRQGDRVVVGINGTAGLKYDGEATTIDLLAATTATIGAEKGAKRLRLNDGTLVCCVAPQAKAFEIRTRHATARVVGTRFSLTAETVKSTLAVQEGRVALCQGEKTLEVEAGELATATEEGMEKKPSDTNREREGL